MKKQLEPNELIQLIKSGKHPRGIRNLGQYAIDIIINMTPNCTEGRIAERMYWIKYDLNERPNCKHCNLELSSKSFRNGGVLGYRDYCSKSCSSLSTVKRDKIKETSQKRYGTDHPLSSTLVQEKRKTTNLERYGIGNPMKWSGSKFIQIMNDKYGGINFSKNSRLKTEHSTTTLLNKRINYLASRSALIEDAKERNLELISNLEDDYIWQESKLKWKCHTCDKISSRVLTRPGCDYCDPKSKPQQELTEFIRGLLPNENIICNDRTVISPFELDIYIPGKKLAIECNGSIWNSTRFNDDKFYHLKKTLLCEQLGIKLMHIWDFQWYQQSEIIKNRITSSLGINKKIFARKCYIGEITTKLADDFLNQHHLQGTSRSSHSFALFYNDMIVGVMTFGNPRFNKSYQWELIRFATFNKTQIVGGASKLLNAFVKRYKPKNMITYADRLLSNGNLYIKLGFKKLRETNPGYFYINNHGKFFSRYQTMKAKLPKLLGKDLDLSQTEEQIMKTHHFYRVYDSGQLVYDLNFDSIMDLMSTQKFLQ
jgi:hypothetical protein